MDLSDFHKDALTEIINVGVGKSAAVLNAMIGTTINLEVPYIKILSVTEMKNEIKRFGIDNLSSVKLNFKGSIDGTAALLFPTSSAATLVSFLAGEESSSSADLDSIRSGTLAEVGNIVLNGVIGSISNMLQRQLNYSVPSYVEAQIQNLLFSNDKEINIAFILANTHFVIEELNVNGDIILVFELDSFDYIIKAIDEMMSN